MSREIERLKRDKKKANANQNYAEMASICNVLGELLAQKGDYEEAIEEHKTELTLSEIKDDRIGVAIANRKIGECYCSLQKFDQALKHQQLHLDIAQQEGNAVEEQRAYTTIGRTYLIQTDTMQDKKKKEDCLEKAETAFQKSLDLCATARGSMSEKDFHQMKARSLLNMGLIYDNRGIITQCAEYTQAAIQISKNYKFWDDIYRCECILAGIYQRHGKSTKALRHWEEAYQAACKSGDKEAQAETLKAKSAVFIDIEDFSASLRCGRKAFKLLQHQNEDDQEYIKSLLIAADKLNREREKLAKGSVNEEDKMKIYEKMGDFTANVTLYKTAIKYYHKMLECGHKCGKSEAELIPAYISLAQTYLDDKQYELAIEYYHKELDLRQDEPSQASKTWWNIAAAQELMFAEYTTVVNSYMKAYKLAERAERRTLQAKALESLSWAQKNYGEEESSKETMKRVEELKDKYEISDNEEEADSQEMEEDSSAEDEDVDFELLLESDESDNEEFDRTQDASNTVGRARRTRAKTFKVNEKGESPLHKACIDGNLKRVKVLIDQGHQLNVRDFSGWLPIHEAANHGFVEIVEYLLDKGAAINDRGGDNCEGITPLHDAASNGKVDVVRLLVTRGANVHAKDDNGATPLDSLKYHGRRCGEMTRQEQAEFNDVVRLLKDTMTGNNPHLSTSIRRTNNRVRSETEYQSDSTDGSGSEDEEPTRRKNKRQRKTSYNSDVPSENGELEDSLVRDYENRSPSPPSPTRSSYRKKKSTSPKRPRQPVVEDDENDSEELYINPALENLERINPQEAAHVYENTISCFRTRTSTQQKPKPRRADFPKPSTSALVDPTEHVGDDWLIDDMLPSNKRKRLDVDHVFSTRGMRRPKSRDSEEEIRPRRSKTSSEDRLEHEEGGTRKRKRSSNDKLTTSVGGHLRNDFSPAGADQDEDDDALRAVDDVLLVNDDSSDENSRDLHSNSQPDTRRDLNSSPNVTVTFQTQISNKKSGLQKVKRQTKLTNFGTITTARTGPRRPLSSVTNQNQVSVPSTQPTVGAPQAGNFVMKFRVNINNIPLVVPVNFQDPGEKTIGFLAREASKRYDDSYQLRPVLRLLTKDGALLSPEDYIVHILDNNEEVHAEIESWDLPPLPLRYEDACKKAKQFAYKNIKSLLQTCVGSYNLNLNNLALRPLKFSPIARALQCQSTLKELHLKGNRLGDNGLKQLINILQTLPNLRILDISSNDITHVGLTALANALSTTAKKELSLQMLEKLEMSYNFLGDGCTSTLATVISKLPRLTHLGLSSCDITKNFFQQHRISFRDSLQASNVHSIDVSYNQLGSTGAELLLKCLKVSTVTDLNLTATIQSYNINHLTKHLMTYTRMNECVLQNLMLDKCCLTQEHSEDLAKLVEQSVSLETLSFSGNPKLSQPDFTLILASSARTDKSQLHSVTFTSCGMNAPINIDFLDAVNDKLNHTHPLRYLDVTCVGLTKVDVDSLLDIWKTRWIDGAKCDTQDNRVTLSVVDIDL